MTNEDFIKEISLESEEWRDVIGFEGLYAVSNLGRVASFERYVVGAGRKCMRYNAPRVMKPVKQSTRNGDYYGISLHKDEKISRYSIHRLVAMHFIPNDNPMRDEVDHINGNPSDNRATNLRWASRSENMRNPHTVKKSSASMIGNKRAPRKAVVRIANGSVKIYESMCEAQRDGFSQPTISLCCKGKAKKHKGYIWLYLSDYENLNISKSKNS